MTDNPRNIVPRHVQERRDARKAQQEIADRQSATRAAARGNREAGAAAAYPSTPARQSPATAPQGGNEQAARSTSDATPAAQVPVVEEKVR